MADLTKTYNGYTNYWTWKIKMEYLDDFTQFYDWVCLDGDNEGLSLDLRRHVQDEIEYRLFNVDSYDMQDVMDMVNNTLDEVDWQELADMLETEAVDDSYDSKFGIDQNVH